MQLTWVLDVLLVLVLLASLIYGYRHGLIYTVTSTFGLVLGGFLAVLAIPLITAWVPAPEWRGAATLAAAVLLVVGGFSLGATVGRVFGRRVDRGPLRLIDRLVGAVINTVVAALVASMVAISLTSMGAPFLAQPVASSAVLSTIDRLSPDPVKAVMARLRSIVLQDGIPRIVDAFTGTIPAVPDLDTATAPLAAAASSVVRITGNAFACGQNQSGTGFVIAEDRILTNAHVVAGVNEPVVETLRDGIRVGRIVYFDAVDDLAIIAVDNLPTVPLAFTADLPEGTDAVVSGYPFGGPFSSHPARVVDVGTVNVPDIYSNNATGRDVYTLAADVQQGESGGPLLSQDGLVAGVIFAKGATSPDVGYAMTRNEAGPVVAQAPGLTAAIESGQCIRG